MLSKYNAYETSRQVNLLLQNYIKLFEMKLLVLSIHVTAGIILICLELNTKSSGFNLKTSPKHKKKNSCSYYLSKKLRLL